MRLITLAILTALLHYTFKTCNALFEEQAGVLDWHRSGLGVLSDFVHSSSTLYVQSRYEGVLAKLSAKTGETSWRVVLPLSDLEGGEQEEALNNIIHIPQAKCLISVSTFYVRRFTLDGMIEWELPLSSSLSSSSSSPSSSLSPLSPSSSLCDFPFRSKLSFQLQLQIIDKCKYTSTHAPHNTSTSALLRRSPSSSSSSSSLSSFSVLSFDRRTVFVSSAAQVTAIDVANGEELWTFTASEPVIGLFIYSDIAANEVELLLVETPTYENSAVLRQKDGSSSSPFWSSSSFLVGRSPNIRAVSVSPSYTLNVTTLNGKQGDDQKLPSSSPAEIERVGTNTNSFTITQDDKKYLYSFSSSPPTFDPAILLPEDAFVTGVSASPSRSKSSSSDATGWTDFQAVITIKGSRLTCVIYSKGVSVATWTAVTPSPSLSVLYASLSPQLTSNIPSSIAITLSDYSCSLLTPSSSSSSSPSSFAWTLDEGVSTLRLSLLVDLPMLTDSLSSLLTNDGAASSSSSSSPSSGADDDDILPFPNIAQRIVPQLQSLLSIAVNIVSDALNSVRKLSTQLTDQLASLSSPSSSISSFPSSSFRSLSSASSSSDRAHRTSLLSSGDFGFNKLLIGASRAQEIYAISTDGHDERQTGASAGGAGAGADERKNEGAVGETVWKINRAALHADKGAEIIKIINMGHHTIAVITADALLGSCTLFTISILTGEIVRTVPLPYLVREVLQIPYTNSHSVRILLLVDSASLVHVYPDTAESVEVASSHISSIYFYRADVIAGTVSGYAISGSDSVFRLVPTWSIVYPRSSEIISSVQERPYEVVQSAVRIIGGENAQSFLYKYLSPSLLAIATVRFAPDSAFPAPLISSVKRTTDPSVVLTLIDAVTGSVIEKYVHTRGTGPVHLAVTENLVVMHYLNTLSHSYEVSVVELFEQRSIPPLTLSTILESFAGTSPISTFNSRLSSTPAHALQQTYMMRSGVRHIMPTRTQRGITNRDFIFALTPSNALLSIPRAFLDPRRSPLESMSANDKAEGLIPFQPELPHDARQQISHRHRVYGIRNIITGPATLESTSVVVAVGLDIFATRVTPSAGFDVINEDFNYPALLLTVAATAIGCAITRKMAKQKDKDRDWK